MTILNLARPTPRLGTVHTSSNRSTETDLHIRYAMLPAWLSAGIPSAVNVDMVLLLTALKHIKVDLKTSS